MPIKEYKNCCVMQREQGLRFKTYIIYEALDIIKPTDTIISR